MPIVDGFTKKANSLALHKCDVYFCLECDHAQLVDVIPPELMFKDYLFRTSDSPQLVDHFKHYARWLVDHFDTSSVVEIGCNDGTLLKLMPHRKIGVDPSNVECSEEKIDDFLTSDVCKEIVKYQGRATLVIANHVFAHTNDLVGMLENIKSLMTSRGKFVFEVAYAHDMLDKCLFDQIEHEHLSYHSIKPLVKFFNKNGMELSQVFRNSCKGGSIRCVAEFIDSGHVPNFMEDCSLERYREFSGQIKEKRERLSEHKSLIGYGAAAPCTSVMYQLDLQDRIKFLVDDNPRRHGLFSPHKNIPVVSSEALNHTNSKVVILAPRYEGEIKQRHPGREFITP